MAPGGFQRNFRKVIFQVTLVIDGWSISCKTALKWMPMDLTDGKSTLLQVMAWCRQAQWVKGTLFGKTASIPQLYGQFCSVDFTNSLQWRHNKCDGVPNYWRLDCLLKRLFRCRPKKTSKLRVADLFRGIHRWPVNFPHKGPATRENVSIWWRHHVMHTITSHPYHRPKT